MRFIVLVFLLVLTVPIQANADKGALVIKASPHGVSKTLDRLKAVLEKKGVTIFARVDHSAGAKKIGAKLRPTELLIFGNPKLGTPLMQSNQKVGIDLPLKALAWKDGTGQVWLGYTKPQVIADRHTIDNRAEVIKKITGALNKLTDAALKP